QYVDLTEEERRRTGDELLLQLLVAHLRGVAAGALGETRRPPVVVRARGRVERSVRELRVDVFGLPRALRRVRRAVVYRQRPRGIGPRVTRWIGDDVGDRHAERLVDAIRHLITRDDLPARRMSRDDDRAHVRKDVLVRELPQDLVDELE